MGLIDAELTPDAQALCRVASSGDSCGVEQPALVGFDHVAFATRDTDATIKVLSALGFAVKIYKQRIDSFNVLITKLVAGTNEQNVAEIVEPCGPRSVVSQLLVGREASVYHSCFRTDDFHATRARLAAAGAIVVTTPMSIPYPVTEAHRSFLTTHMFHPYLGLFEITGPTAERPFYSPDTESRKP